MIPFGCSIIREGKGEKERKTSELKISLLLFYDSHLCGYLLRLARTTLRKWRANYLDNRIFSYRWVFGLFCNTRGSEKIALDNVASKYSFVDGYNWEMVVKQQNVGDSQKNSIRYYISQFFNIYRLIFDSVFVFFFGLQSLFNQHVLDIICWYV